MTERKTVKERKRDIKIDREKERDSKRKKEGEIDR
jgi:hypothetical protein